jgi:hypothetical protein
MNGKNHSSSIAIRWRGLLGAALIAVAIQPADAAVDSARLMLPAQADEVSENLGKVFEPQIGDRCGARVILDGDAPLTVELAVEAGIGTEVVIRTLEQNHRMRWWPGKLEGAALEIITRNNK